MDSVKNTSGNMNRVDLEEESTESFIMYLEDHNMLDQYVSDHNPFAHHVVDNVPGTARDSLGTFLEKLGYNQKDIANYLKKHEKEISSAVNIPDPNLLRQLMMRFVNQRSFLSMLIM